MTVGINFKRAGASALLIASLSTAFVTGLTVGAPVHSASAQATDPDTQLFEKLYKQVNPSVVSIYVRIPNTPVNPSGNGNGNGLPNFPTLPAPKSDGGTPAPTLPPDNSGNGNGANPFGNQQQPPFSAGDASGFIYGTDGYIITNSHVVQDADRIEVTFADDTTVTAKVVGIDRDSDLAVIKVQTDASRLIPVTFADSDKLVIGQRVFAIGNPFNYANSMSTGIVSGLNRRLDSQASTNGGQDTYQIPGLVQTDTAINPGNSGGPLFDTTGAVVGINTLIESQVRQSSGVGFALPSNLVQKFVPVLIKNGTVDHSYLGIQGGDLTVDLNTLMGIDPNQHGVLISTVTSGGPADKAGLLASTVKKSLDGVSIKVGGDIIVAVDGTPIHHFVDLLGYLFTKTDVGQKITVTVLRNGKQIDVPITLEARPH